MARRKSKGPTKLALVKEALASGLTSPVAIQEHLKKLKVTMTPATISNYKSVLKSKAAQESKPTNGRKKRRGRQRMALISSSNGGRHRFLSDSLLKSLVRLKDLVRELGADETKKLVDVLA
jgi:hypothetical protein